MNFISVCSFCTNASYWLIDRSIDSGFGRVLIRNYGDSAMPAETSRVNSWHQFLYNHSNSQKYSKNFQVLMINQYLELRLVPNCLEYYMKIWSALVKTGSCVLLARNNKTTIMCSYPLLCGHTKKFVSETFIIMNDSFLHFSMNLFSGRSTSFNQNQQP